MTRSFNYDLCLLGFVNVDLDPMAQMNVWASSSENHQWNPGQSSPGTSWEAETDRMMRQVGSASDFKVRKAAFDRVQEIAYEEEPFIYLVQKHVLAAVGPAVQGVKLVSVWPGTFWNVDSLVVRR